MPVETVFVVLENVDYEARDRFLGVYGTEEDALARVEERPIEKYCWDELKVVELALGESKGTVLHSWERERYSSDGIEPSPGSRDGWIDGSALPSECEVSYERNDDGSITKVHGTDHPSEG